MKHDNEKAKRILAEIIGYFIDHDIHSLEVLFSHLEDGFHIEVYGRTSHPPEVFEELRRALSDGFQPEMEEYYLQLLDMGSGKEQYYLLGTMIDQAEVTCVDGVLRVKVLKKDAR
jgi:hypothetical protein